MKAVLIIIGGYLKKFLSLPFSNARRLDRIEILLHAVCVKIDILSKAMGVQHGHRNFDRDRIDNPS